MFYPLEFHEDGTPKFKINKDTAYILDSILLSETNKAISTRNAIRNSAYISSVYEGAELEKNARENFIARYGQANYDKYGVLPPQVMDRLQYEERVQNYVSQGYTEQEAVQYANTYRERELQGWRTGLMYFTPGMTGRIYRTMSYTRLRIFLLGYMSG